MGDVFKWMLGLLKGLLPAAGRDPVSAAFAILSIASEIIVLSLWQFWVPASLGVFDVASPVLLSVFLWRQSRRKWAEAPLCLAVAILLFVLLVFFSYTVPIKRLAITLAEFVITTMIVVRNYS